MKSKQIIQMVSLGILLLLCVSAYIFMKQYNNKNEDDSVEEESSQTILSMDSSSISKLSYTYEGEQLGFVCKDGSWYYKQDEKFPLNTSYIENILTALSSLFAERKLEDNLDNLKEYGLDSPQITVTATDTEENEITLYIGNYNDSTGNYYCYQKDDTIIYMINEELATALKYKLYDMAEMESLPSISSSSIYEMSIGDETFIYTESGKSDYDYTGYATWFHVNEDGSYTAVSANACSNILTAFTEISYQSMVEYNADENALETYGFNSARMIHIKYKETYEKTDSEETSSAETETSESETITVEKDIILLIGKQNAAGDYYVKTQDSNEIKVVSASTIDTILKTDAATMMNQDVFRIKYDSIISIALQSAENEYPLMEESALVNEEDDSLLSKITGMTSEQTLSEEFTPNGEPALTIRYTLDNSKYETITMKFYEYNGSYYAAKINGETGLLVTKAQIKDIISAIAK